MHLGRSVGVALLDVDGQSVAAWFHLARVAGGRPASGRTGDSGPWRLEWVPVDVAALELAQLEERRLLRRALVDESLVARAGARLRTASSRFVGSDARVPALAASLGFWLAASWRGWLSTPADAPDALEGQLPRLVLAALAGGWLSAALRSETRRATGVLARALTGGVLGTLTAALLAGGLMSSVTLGSSGALLVAWLAGFLERLVGRRTPD